MDASGEHSSIPASGEKATGDESWTDRAGRLSASDSGSDKDDGDDDRRFCDDVFARYERFGDADQSTLAFPMLGGGRAEPWTRHGLRHVFVHACTVGSGGVMTQRELKDLYNFTRKVEAATDAVRSRPFTDAFKTVWRFIAAVRRYKRTLITPLNWKKVIMKIDGRQYTVFFRDALQAAQDEAMRAKPDDLYWGRPSRTGQDSSSADASTGASTTSPDTVLRNAWDGEMYQQQQEHVDGTVHPGTRVLGFYLYSDATVLSSSGAVSAYPLRMRVINIDTDEVRWVTLAYIPQVENKFLETMKGQEVRSELLQRIIHVVFRTSLLASHDGTWLNLPGGGCVRVSPRALLYVCDQPEERAIMCLKGFGCLFPCTSCTVGRDSSCAEAGTNAPARDVHETVRAQLRDVLMGDFRGSSAMRTETETAHSLNSMVPALAAWAGLGNGPRMLYRLPGFDRLHVRFSQSTRVFSLPSCFFGCSVLWQCPVPGRVC